eukprot:79072_1
MASLDSKEEYNCRKCRMKFDSKLKLANHINKFCADSIYGEPHKLLKQLKLQQQESRNPSHLSFGEIQDYLQNEMNNNIGNKVGKLTLSDLRRKFETQASDQDLEALKAEIIKRREKELITQLKELKHKEAQLIVSRKKNETLLSEKLEIFNKDKEQEMKARLERERIKRLIKNVDEKDLITINQEKKKEIQELRQLRAALQAQEDAATKEMNELTLKIQKEEDAFKHKKDRLFKIKNKKGAKFEAIRAKIIENAHKHGTYSAQLQIQRDNLQNTKSILMKQLQNKNLNETDKKLILSNVKQKLNQQMSSIQTLRDRFDTDNAEMTKQMQMHDQLFQKLTTDPGAVDLGQYFDRNEAVTVQEETSEKEMKSERVQKETANKKQQQKALEPQHKEEDQPQPLEEHMKQQTTNNTTKQDPTPELRNPTQTQNVSNPPHHTNQTPQYQAQYPSYPPPYPQMPGYATHPPHPQMAPYMQPYPPQPHPHYPYMMQPSYPMHMMQPSYPMHMMQPSYPNPMMNQLNQQFEVTQKLLKQHELESELLQNEIKHMHQKQQNDKNKASQNEFQHTLHMLKSKLTNGEPTLDMDFSVTEDASINMHKKHGMLGELNDFEKEERRLLTLIAKFSDETELKQLYVKQLRSITSGKFELEQMYQQKKLKKLKHEISSYEDQLIAETQHDNWLKEQRRLLERKKIEKELAAQGLLKKKQPIPHQNDQFARATEHKSSHTLDNKLTAYNNNGFTICFDFIIGFTARYKQCRLATSHVNGVQIEQQTLETSAWEDIYERNHETNNGNYISMIQITKHVQNRNGSEQSKVLIDVQVKDKQNNESHYAWCMITPLFIQSTNNDSNPWLLPQGLWKISLLNPPIMIHANADSMHQIPKRAATLYFRIIPDCNTTAIDDADTEDLQKYVEYKPLSLIVHTPPTMDEIEAHPVVTDAVIEELKENTNDDRVLTATTTTLSSVRRRRAHAKEDSVSTTHSSARSTQLYDAQNGIGVLVKFLEHQSRFPFAKIKVSLYDKDEIALDAFGNTTVWETDYAQEGISSLGVYEWEQRHIFDHFPYLTECVVVVELFESKDPNNNNMDNDGGNDELSRPLTSYSSRSNVSKSADNEANEVATLWSIAKVFRIDEITSKPVISSGLHELNLYKYPIDFENPLPFDEDSMLRINIFDPCDQPMVKNDVILLSNDVLLDTIQEVSDRPWIRVENKANTWNIFEDGDGVDLYVDGARFLPSNTSITKLYVQLMWREVDGATGEQIGLHKDSAPEFTYCDTGESCYNPVFNLRHEYRKDIFDKHCICIFRLDTIELYTHKCQILGYSALNLFVDNDNQNDCKYLNEGSFQLSLYRQPPPFDALTMTNVLAQERLPCSTLLVRIAKAPRSDDGTTVLGLSNVDCAEWNKYNLVLPTPSYGDAVYDTCLCEPSVQELRLYNSLMKTRVDKQISLILEEEFKSEIDLDLDDEIDETEFNKWCDDRLKPPPKSEVEFISLSHFAPYNQSMGVAVSIDSICNIKSSNSNSLYIVIYTISPPFSFYEKDFKITDNVEFTYNWNLDSITTQPKFIKDKLKIFKDSDFEFHQNAILFTDIREIRFKSNDGSNISELEIIKCGFSFFPLFTSRDSPDGGKFCRNGVFQNIVFRYPESEENMLSILNKIVNNGYQDMIKTECAVNKKGKKDKLLKPMDGCVSILVQLYDNQRSSVGITEPSSYNNELILKALRNDYLLNQKKKKAKSWLFGKSETTLKSALSNQKVTDHKAFCKKLRQAIAKQLDITHYNF